MSIDDMIICNRIFINEVISNDSDTLIIESSLLINITMNAVNITIDNCVLFDSMIYNQAADGYTSIRYCRFINVLPIEVIGILGDRIVDIAEPHARVLFKIELPWIKLITNGDDIYYEYADGYFTPLSTAQISNYNDIIKLIDYYLKTQ